MLQKDYFTKYLVWITAQYAQAKARTREEIKNSTLDIKYKITSTYEEYQQTGYLLIQSKNGAAYSYMKPKEICADKFIISHMHPLDVNLITKIHWQEQDVLGAHSATQYKILKQSLCAETAETIYTIYNPVDDNCIELTEKQLLDSPYFLKYLNGNDGISIGFELGIKHSTRLQKLE